MAVVIIILGVLSELLQGKSLAAIVLLAQATTDAQRRLAAFRERTESFEGFYMQ